MSAKVQGRVHSVSPGNVRLARPEPKFEDQYETALVELLRQKQAGQPVEPIGEEKPPVRVINLMDALRASLKGEEEKKPAAASMDTRRAATKKKTSR